MITYKLPTKMLGDIDIEIADNLNDVQLHHIGRASIQYSSFSPDDIFINCIATNPYSMDVNLKIISLLKEKGIDQRINIIYNENHIPIKAGMIINATRPCNDADNIGGFEFRVPDELKQLIIREYTSIYNAFVDDMRNGRIEVKYNGEIILAESDIYQGLRMWGLFSHLIYRTLDLKYMYDWGEVLHTWKAGDIVTKDVAPIVDQKLKIWEQAEKEKAEYIRKLFENVASYQQTKPKIYNEDEDYEIIVKIVMKSGKKYNFSARNIEDIGLVINPLWREDGIYINLDEVLKSLPGRIEWVDACRKITSSKYVLSTFDKGILGVSQEEMQAYEVVLYLTRGDREVRL